MSTVGIIANILNSVALIPQIKESVTTWDVSDMSYGWLGLSLIANAMWIIYGYLTKKNQILIMGVVFSFFYGLNVFIKLNPNMRKGTSKKEKK